jgi:hypothetical protein
MYNLIKLFFTGMLISFAGSLPLGSLNVTAMQIAHSENIKKAWQFALAVALVEIAYVRISLEAMDWVVAHQQFFYWMEWLTVLLFLILAFSSFWLVNKNKPQQKNILLNNNINRFWLGLTMSAINPVQIPFWFIWSTYLLSNQVLLPTPLEFNTYTFGIGTGTIFGLLIFIYAGSWLINKIHASNQWINLVVGIVFLISAAIQLYRVVYKPFVAAAPQHSIWITTSPQYFYRT